MSVEGVGVCGGLAEWCRRDGCVMEGVGVWWWVGSVVEGWIYCWGSSVVGGGHVVGGVVM